MSIERVAGVIGLICFAAYFVERLGLTDLPGISTDYSTLGMLAMGTIFMALRTQSTPEVRGVDG